MLRGEDPLFFTMICNGVDGGILAAAHLATERFVEVAHLVASNDHVAARTIWSSLRDLIPGPVSGGEPDADQILPLATGLIRVPQTVNHATNWTNICQDATANHSDK